MTKIRLLFATLALLACEAPAVAADWYGEFHVGTTRADTNTLTFDERVEGAYGIGVGVKYNEWFSTQLDWHTLGENSTPTPCLPPALCVLAVHPEHGWALRALPRLPLGKSFAFELGIGLMRWEGDLAAYGLALDDSGTDWMYSFGLEWRFTERWSATAEMQVLELDGADFDWTGATLRYRF